MVLVQRGDGWTMENKNYDVALEDLEDDLSTLEEHAKHVVALLGRRVADLGDRVAALTQSSLLFEKIREIKDKVHALHSNR